MGKITAFIKQFFSAELPTELVFFNIISIMGIAGGIIITPFNIGNGLPMIQTYAIIASAVITGFCIYAANYKSRLRDATIVMCFSVSIILFPVMFFSGGGVSSGMICWFSLGMLFIFMLLDGMDFFFMLLMNMAAIVGCYVVAYYHPEYIYMLSSKQAVYVDMVQSLLITTITVGMVIKFQISIYSKLYTKAEYNNDELLEKTLAAKRAEHVAQTATEAKSNFLANMSHEIRTPINTIMGMDEMILRETSEKKVEEYALDIRSASQTLLSLINDILDITKIESGKMEIIDGEYSFMGLMHDVMNNATIRAKEKDLKLEIEVPEEVPCELIGDDVRVRQVLTNIITNAVKYTHEGGVKINVECNRNFDNTVDLTFAVTDTGIGIRQEDLKRLFESFERLEVSRNRNIEGAGLGMAITQNILHLMDSHLRVESVYGEGSTFSFTINQGIANPEPIGDFHQRLSHMTSTYEYNTTFEAPEAKFLVVDDNTMNRKVFVALLKEAKIQISEAADGREALRLVKNQHFDMIFLDHMMPGMDGVETFKEMQNMTDSMCVGTPVIALTANAIAGAKERYLSIGFHGFLSKPIVPAQLEKMIRDYLPESLLQYHEQTEEQKRPERKANVELPEIEGVDWEYALLHFPDAGLVLQTAIDFVNSIGYEYEGIASVFKGIEAGDLSLVDDYRIKVHGVKSMANTIGATSLGGLAKTCEYAARDNKIERILAITPVLMEEMMATKDRLSVLSEDVEKPRMEDMDDLWAFLEMLRVAIYTNDLDNMDKVMKQIVAYSYDEDKQIIIDELYQHVVNLQNDEAIDDIIKLQQ